MIYEERQGLGMYETLLVFSDEALLHKVSVLPIWGAKSGFEIGAAEKSGVAAYDRIRAHRYDLVIVQAELNGLNGFQLLERAKAENLCSHVVLYSEFFDYRRARQGMIYGAFDYFWRECSAKMLLSVFGRIKKAADHHEGRQLHAEDLLGYFIRRDDALHERLPAVLDELYLSSLDFGRTDENLRSVYEKVIEQVFADNDWLELYIDRADLTVPEDFSLSGEEDLRSFCANRLLDLFDIYCELFPKVSNDKLCDVLLYILRNPESRLKQKDIAANLYLNSSFLSIMFTSQTERRFVDYLTAVKFRRACYLLKKTSLPIGEIASKLDYKDTGYFSHLFKKRCGMTPSEYRIPDGYDYQI